MMRVNSNTEECNMPLNFTNKTLPDGTVIKEYDIPQPHAVYVHEVYHVQETAYPDGRMTKVTGGNYDVYDQARYGFRKEEEFFNGKPVSTKLYLDGRQVGLEEYKDGRLVRDELTMRGETTRRFYQEFGYMKKEVINSRGTSVSYFDEKNNCVTEKKYLAAEKKYAKMQQKLSRDKQKKHITEETKSNYALAGIAGLVTAVSVTTYIASSYPNKEKAPEDKKVEPTEATASQSTLTDNEILMFQMAIVGRTAMLKNHMEHHKDININATNKDGETALMLALVYDRLDVAEYLLEKFGDKIEYKARTNEGIGYQDIMKARLHSPKANAQDLKINRMIKANTKKEEQQIKEGKARSTDSYAFYDAMNSRTK